MPAARHARQGGLCGPACGGAHPQALRAGPRRPERRPASSVRSGTSTPSPVAASPHARLHDSDPPMSASPPGPARPKRARGDQTRERILDVAERLYSERGVDGVSLREIRLAAGQRNSSAIQFHFGDAIGLQLALSKRHMPRVGDLAEAAYATIVSEGRADDPAALTTVMVSCWADYTELGPSQRAYVRISAAESPRPERTVKDFQEHAPEVFLKVGGTLLGHLQEFLPADIALARIFAVGQMGQHLCADRARVLEAGPSALGAPLLDAATFKANLLEMTSAAMLAPHTPPEQ